MSGKPAKQPYLAVLIVRLGPLLVGLGMLVLAALHAPKAAQELPKAMQDLMAFPFDQLFVHDTQNILPVVVFLPLGISFIWRYFRSRASLTPLDSPMAGVRQRIDDLDDQIVTLLAQRQRQIEAAAEVKCNNAIPARVPERVDEVLRRVATRARNENLDGGLAKSLWTNIIEWSIAYEERLMKASGEKRDRT